MSVTGNGFITRERIGSSSSKDHSQRFDYFSENSADDSDHYCASYIVQRYMIQTERIRVIVI